MIVSTKHFTEFTTLHTTGIALVLLHWWSGRCLCMHFMLYSQVVMIFFIRKSDSPSKTWLYRVRFGIPGNSLLLLRLQIISMEFTAVFTHMPYAQTDCRRIQQNSSINIEYRQYERFENFHRLHPTADLFLVVAVQHCRHASCLFLSAHTGHIEAQTADGFPFT